MRALLLALAIATTLPPTAGAQSPYRLLAKLTNDGLFHQGYPAQPTAIPPMRFLHWDLREFPSCTVPYARCQNGHADNDPGNEFTAVRTAAESWNAVAPAIVELTPQAFFTATNTIGMDGESVILWDGGIQTPNLDLIDANGGPNLIGLTCLFFNGNMVITESDIIFNDRDWQWNTATQNTDEFVLTSNVEPFALADGDTLTIKIDGGAEQTITFDTADFADITMATRAEVRDAINDQLVGGTASSFASGRVGIKSDRAYDGGHTVEITGGTGNGALGFPLGVVKLKLVDVESIAVHELGHFLGIHHTTTAGPPGGPIMTAAAEPHATKRALTAEDQQALNFLYTPDLGDAPDPTYQTTVTTATPSRMLNGVQLVAPGTGPVHLFGYQGAAPYQGDRFEWLGADMDDHPSECAPRLVDADAHDDGVVAPNPLIRGATNRITVTVSHSAQTGRYVGNDDVCLITDAFGCLCNRPTAGNIIFIGPGADNVLQTPPNNCPGGGDDTTPGNILIDSGANNRMNTIVPNVVAAPRSKQLHMNGYLDFANDGTFGLADLALYWSGVPAVAAAGGVPASPCTTAASSTNFVPPAVCGANTVTLNFDVFVPFDAPTNLVSRYRLDYGEDEGREANWSGTLGPAVGAAQFGEVEDYRQTTAPRRHYQCYEAHGPDAPFSTVALDDAFGPGPGLELRDAHRLCNPANKNNEDPNATNDPTHLVGYRIRQPGFQRIDEIEVVDQFGTKEVDVIKPDYMFVPSTKSLTAPPGPPPDPPVVNHFKCYKVKGQRFRRPGVQVVDQFGNRSYDIKKPIRLCIPADKNDEGIVNREAALLCYKVRLTPPVSYVAPGDAYVNNQFGQATLPLRRPTELCTPAVVNP